MTFPHSNSQQAHRAFLWLLCVLLVAAAVHAQNQRSILPVIVAPEDANGSLTPNTLYNYNFVFSATNGCVPLLNISQAITTNSRGTGSAELDISSLVTTPSYICEYVNGVLRKVHPMFSTTFDNKTAAADILNYGFNTTSQLDTYFLRNGSLPTCAGGQVLTSTGNGEFTCVADQQSAGNTSWNQTFASTLYAPLGSSNSSWNETRANALYAPISVVGDNSTWNQALANTLYATIGSGNASWTQTFANGKYYSITNGSLDNASWNQGLANTLYAPISVTGDNSTWNQALAATLFASINTISDNRTWNETRANALYAPISVTGGNASWNETRANSLYALINVTGDNASWSQTFANGKYYTTANGSLDNSTWNQGLANTLYAPISVTGGNASWNETRANSLYALINVTGDNSSWNQALAATLFASINTISDNRTWNETRANALYAPLGSGNNSWNESYATGKFYTTTNGSLANTSWTESYANGKYYAITNGSLDNASWNQGLANTLYAAIGTGGNASWNETRANGLYLSTNGTAVNSNQLGGQAPSYFLNASGGTYDNASWNQGLANTLYAPINATGGNNSWNEGYANGKYYAIANGSLDNASWNQGVANAVYYPSNSNPLGYYNSSTIPAGGNASWNETRANALYAPISTVGDNTSWNENYATGRFFTITNGSLENTSWNQGLANTLYAPINATGDNASWSESYANGKYYTVTNGSLANISWTESYANGKYYAIGNGSLDNSSWNQGVANGLYYPSNSNPLGYYNASTIPAGGNASWNETRANAIYAPIGTIGDNTSWTESYANGKYYTAANGSLDNASWNQGLANTLYLGIGGTATNSGLLAGQAGNYYWNTTTALITTAQAFAALGNATAVNTTANIQSLGFGTTAQLSIQFLNISDQRYNDTAAVSAETTNRANNDTATNGRIDSLNATKLDANDQQYNDTASVNAVNTTANVQSLGFNTTTQLDGRYYASNNPLGFFNSTNLPIDNDTLFALNSSLTAELANRANNESAINAAISAETANRANNDTATNGRIDSLNASKMNTNAIIDGEKVNLSPSIQYHFVSTNVSGALHELADYKDYTGSAGWVSGGILTSDGGTQVNVSAGEGFARQGTKLIDIEWANTSFTLSPGLTYFSVDATGTVLTSPTKPAIDHVVLGIAYISASGTGLVSSEPLRGTNVDYYQNQYIQNAVGAIVESGLATTVNSTDNVSVAIGGGVTDTVTDQYTTLPMTSMRIFYQVGANNWTFGGISAVVNTTHYNDISTGLTQIPDGNFTKDMIVVDYKRSIAYFIYGQAVYDTKQEAEAAPLPDIPAALEPFAIKASAVIVNGTEDINGRIYDIRPSLARLFSNAQIGAVGGTTIAHSSLTGLLANDHPQYLQRAGDDAAGNQMTGDLDMGGQNIVNVGGINASTYLTVSTNNTFNIILGKANVDNYAQINIQNQNNGSSASSDIVATANNGDESSYYIDMGIDGQNYSNPSYTIGGNQTAYLLAQSVPLVIGTNTPGQNLILYTGGSTVGNERITISDTMLNFTGAAIFNDTVTANGFIGNINASYVQNAPWLLAGDQRYNTTVGVSAVNSSLSGRIDSINATKLDANDQRYNDTATVVSVNGSLNTEISNRQNNETSIRSAITGVNSSSNIQSLGFNTTTQLNAIYLAAGATAANSNQLGGQAPTYYLNTTGGAYDNATWAQSLASTLYYPLNTNPLGYYNSSSIPQGLNASWNETRANALYAPIGLTGDNSTWNETRAKLIFLQNGTDSNFGTLNVTTKLNVVSTNLTTLQIGENGNLYYTDARVAAAIQNTTILRNNSNVIFGQANITTANISQLNVGTTNLTTGQIAEGTNLYYTDTRAAAALQNTSIVRNGSSALLIKLNVTTINVSNEFVGTTNLTTGQITEGTNLYYTDTRAAAALQNTSIVRNNSDAIFGKLNATTANISNLFVGTTNLTTGQITEGSNLYYTDTRAAAALQNTSIVRNGSSALLIKLNVTTINVSNEFVGTTNLTTGQITEGTNLYYTDARVAAAIQNTSIVRNGSDAIIGKANITTANISNLFVGTTNITTGQITEGSNLYYTDTRAAAAIQNTTLLRNGSNANFNILNASTFNVGTTNLTCAQIGGCVVGATANALANGSDANHAILNVTTKLNAVATNLTTLQITENGNLYYTDARAASAMQNGSILRNGTNVIFGTANITTANVSQLNVGTTNLTTSQIAEGANLYYTDAKAAAALQNTSIVRNGSDVNFRNITGVNISANTVVNTPDLCLNGDCRTAWPTGNNSWNESYANGIYYPTNTNPLGFYNSTTLPAGGNSSWNETRANALYAPIATIGDNTSWTENYANGKFYAIDNGSLDNSTWAQSLADTLYAPIATISYNNSWNETYANTLYLRNNSDANLATLNITTQLNAAATNLTTLQIGENGNLYYTDARVAAAIQNTSIVRNGSSALLIKLNVTTINVSSEFVGTTNLTTGQITEGSNLYYTDTRAAAALQNTSIVRNGSSALLIKLNVTTINVSNEFVGTTNLTTGQITEGTNLYYTDTRAAAALQNTSIVRNNSDAIFGKLNATTANISSLFAIGANFTSSTITTINTTSISATTSYIGGKTICLTDGTNCPGALAGSIGNVTGNGTPNYLTMWSGTLSTVNNISNSNIYQTTTSNDKLNGQNVVINGTLTVNGPIYENNGVEVTTTTTYGCPFMVTVATTMCYPNYLGVAVGAGTEGNAPGVPQHPGSMMFNSSAAANTGWAMTTSVIAFRLNGSEEFRTSMNLSEAGGTLTNTSRTRFGFIDTVSTATVVDGVYFDVWTNSSGMFVAGFTANNSQYNNTANFSLPINQWYHYDLAIAPDASNVTFRIYDDNNALIWNASIIGTTVAHIPVIAGRETGAGFVGYRAIAGTARAIGTIDYMVTEIRTPRRAYG